MVFILFLKINGYIGFAFYLKLRNLIESSLIYFKMLSIEKEPSEYGEHMVMLSLSKQKKRGKKGSKSGRHVTAKC